MASPSQRATSRRKQASRASGTSTAPAENASQDPAAFTFAQEQLQAAITLADLVFKGAEEIRRVQLEAAHHAHERHEKALAEVSAAANPSELLRLQAELLRDDLETAGQYWQQITTACAQLQTEALSVMARSSATAGGGMARMAARPLAGLPVLQPQEPEPAPQVQAVDPTRAWNQWADLGKQWTEMLYRTDTSLH